MNKAILIGNLTRDPETRTTASGVTMCQFTIAVNRRFVNQQGVREADFIPIVTWRQTAELCSRYLSKGRKVAVEGVIQVRSYDAQDGSKRYVTEVVADNVEFLSSPQGDRQQRADNPPPPSEPSGYSSDPDAFTDVDDELPF